MKTMTIHFRFRNSTKGAHRYDEVSKGEILKGDDAVVGSLYIRKRAMSEAAAILKMTLEEA